MPAVSPSAKKPGSAKPATRGVKNYYRSMPWQFYLTRNIPDVVYQNLETVRLQVLHQMLGQRRYPRTFAKVLVGKDIPLESLRAMKVECTELERTALCEAIIPTPKHGRIGAVVYYGWANHRILLTREVCEKENTQLRTITNKLKKKTVLPPGYTYQITEAGESWKHDDVEKLCEIYRHAFPQYVGGEFTLDSTHLLLHNNCSIIIRRNTEIAAVALMDTYRLPNGKEHHDFGMADITEVAVHEDHLGKGLCNVLYDKSIEYLLGKGFDVVYSECRAACYGVLSAAHNSGMEVCGHLPSHIECSSPINDVARKQCQRKRGGPKTPYENLTVFAITRQ